MKEKNVRNVWKIKILNIVQIVMKDIMYHIKRKGQNVLNVKIICLECFGLVTFSYCYICKEGYEPINGKCEKPVVKTGEIPNCIIGEGEKCKSCDSNQPEFCGSCNEGYYLSQYDKTKCK